jgi:hypothetical protein
MSALLITPAVMSFGGHGFGGPAIPDELKPVVMGLLAVAILIYAVGGKRRE